VSEVLVIGAAGKTGRAVTRALLARGDVVRAGVRPGSPSTPYAGASVHVVPLDLVSGTGLPVAVAGVDAVYHLAPNVHPDEVGMARRVAEAAAAEGISRFAFHSVLHPDDTSMPHHVRKGEAERVVRDVLPTSTVLRPAAYHQNLVDAARAGRIAVPYSLDTPFTNVDLDDVAEVAARVLIEDGHEGATHDLAGPEALSVRQLAATASDVFGHRVEAVQMPLSEWEEGAGAALDASARADLAAMFRAYDREGLVGDPSALRALLGREPRTWREVLARTT